MWNWNILHTSALANFLPIGPVIEQCHRTSTSDMVTLRPYWKETVQFSSVQSLSHVRLFATPWIAARQASLSITNSRSSLRLTSIESMISSSHLVLCLPLLSCPNPSQHQSLFQWVNSSHEVAKVLEFQLWHHSFQTNTQDWSPLEWTSWISLQSKGLSRVFSNTTVQKHQFFGAQPSSQSNSHIHTWPLEKPQPWLDGPLLAK